MIERFGENSEIDLPSFVSARDFLKVVAHVTREACSEFQFPGDYHRPSLLFRRA